MKTFKNQADQGDLHIERVDSLPEGVKQIPAQDKNHNKVHIVAHSESGHHHYVNAAGARFYGTDNPMICYLQVDGEYADLLHDRNFDTHDTIRIPNGTFKLYRQREFTPEGWRRIED